MVSADDKSNNAAAIMARMDHPPSPDNYSQRITAITPETADGNRVTVKVNGKKVVTLSAKSIAELDLYVDRPWDDALATAATTAAEYDKTLQTALAILNRRPKSVRQLATKLRQKGHATNVIDRVTDRLVELGILNDYLFGQILIRDTRSRKPAGARLLQFKLSQAGLESDTINQLMEEDEMPHDQIVAQAANLARKSLRAASRKQPEPLVVKKRLWSILARRGFASDTIETALNDVMSHS